MPFPTDNNIEIVVRGHFVETDGTVKQLRNVFCYNRQNIVNPNTKASINTAFIATVVGPMMAALNQEYFMDGVSIRSLDDATDPYQDFVNVTNGAILSDAAPTDTAVYLLIRTAKRGRSYKGSKHFGPLSEVDTTQNVLTGAGLARWRTVRDAVGLSFTADTSNIWQATIVSRKLSQLAVNPTNVVWTAALVPILNLTVGTMRKRREKTTR